MQVTQGDLMAALTSYQAALAIAERLAKADPGNAVWQRDLAVSHGKLVGAFRSAGQNQEARDHLTVGRAVIARLVEQHPAQATWKRLLAWFDEQIAALRP